MLVATIVLVVSLVVIAKLPNWDVTWMPPYASLWHIEFRGKYRWFVFCCQLGKLKIRFWRNAESAQIVKFRKAQCYR